MIELPESIKQSLENLRRAGPNPDKVAAYRADVDIYLLGILLENLYGLSTELKETRNQMERSSKEASQQTADLVATTKKYTGITRGIFIAACVALILPLFEAWNAKEAAKRAQEARCDIIHYGLEDTQIDRTMLAGQVLFNKEEGENVQKGLEQMEKRLQQQLQEGKCPPK